MVPWIVTLLLLVAPPESRIAPWDGAGDPTLDRDELGLDELTPADPCSGAAG
jgi:hypothetical protein